MIRFNDISNNHINSISLELDGNGVFRLAASSENEGAEIVKILTGRDYSFGGEIVINDDAFRSEDGETSLVKLRKRIGYFSRSPYFYGNMTVNETLEFIGEAKGIDSDLLYRQIKEALELTGIDRLKDVLCEKLNRSQSRRLSLASAFLGNPDLIIAEEPYEDFGESEREEIGNILRMVGNVKPVLIVLYAYDTEELCDETEEISEEGEDESDI